MKKLSTIFVLWLASSIGIFYLTSHNPFIYIFTGFMPLATIIVYLGGVFLSFLLVPIFVYALGPESIQNVRRIAKIGTVVIAAFCAYIFMFSGWDGMRVTYLICDRGGALCINSIPSFTPVLINVLTVMTILAAYIWFISSLQKQSHGEIPGQQDERLASIISTKWNVLVAILGLIIIVDMCAPIQSASHLCGSYNGDRYSLLLGQYDEFRQKYDEAQSQQKEPSSLVSAARHCPDSGGFGEIINQDDTLYLL